MFGVFPTVLVDADGHGFWSDARDFALGAANAFGSDNLLGAGRVDGNSIAYKFGQVAGDGAAVITSFNEIGGGVAGEVGGGALDLTGGGALIGVPVNVVSAGVIVHGTATGTNAVVKQLDQQNANQNGGQNKCTECGQDVQKVQNKKGETPPGNQLQRHHDPQLSKGGNSKSDTNRVVCRTCHVKIHKTIKQQGQTK